MRMTLTIRADMEEFAKLQQIMAAFAESQGWTPELTYQVELVLEEICLNIVNYGFDGDGLHQIDISLHSTPDTLTVDIIDNGRAFDPLSEAAAPDLTSDVNDRPIGGLGVYLVKTMMDELHYRREDERNHLTAVKRLGA